MSTNISFAISSTDQDELTSKCFYDLRKADSDCFNLQPHNAPDGTQSCERRHTGLGLEAAGPDFFESGSSKLKWWRHPNRDSFTDSKSISKEQVYMGDFYDEVDERMSRNSLEYPEEQAKYINRWLGNINSIRSKSFEDDSTRIKGNVIGIRGFSSENSVAASNQRENYNKLKSDYLKLKLDHNRLRTRFDDTTQKYRKIFKKKENDLDILKAIVSKQGKKAGNSLVCDICQRLNKDKPTCVSGIQEIELEQLRYDLRRLELKLSQKDREHEEVVKNMRLENERLRGQVEDSSNELENLRNQIKNLSLEPGNRTLLALYNENLRLKDTSDADMIEFQVLKDNYAKLEAQLKCVCQDQKCLDEERNEEVARMMVELCRLQVYQPKLESILETERQIKLELQARIENLQKDNEQLQDNVKALTRELNVERVRSKGLESSEIDALQNEVSRWQEKCHRLKKEKSDIEDLLRMSKSKVSFLDSKLHNEINLVKEASRHEIDKANANCIKLEAEKDALMSKLDQLDERINQYEMERQKLNEELLTAHEKLELANRRPSEAQILNKLKQSEDKVIALRSQLQMAEAKSNDLLNEIETSRSRMEHSEQQLDDLKRRFDLQQRAFDELKEKKDKELARLRVDLNFEQYNRQVALKGIEKELRSSLKELEAMKYRFSKRLNVQSESIGKTSGGNRVHFNGPVTIQSTTKLQPQPSQQQRQQEKSVAAKPISGPFQGDTS